ncbi:unnamed protein product [Rhizopus stolonifer]
MSNNNPYDNYNSQPSRHPFIIKQQNYAPAYSQYNAYYPSSVNNGNPAYIFESENYSSAQPQITSPQPALQEFVDEVIPTEPDEFIIDLLKKPQERLFLLKLELEFEGLIKDKQRFRLDFPDMNSYQRLMIHKLAPYYKLNHFHDGSRKGVYVCKTVITELPTVRLQNVNLSGETEEKPQSTSMPVRQFKIMRRSDGASNSSSRSSGDEDQTKNGVIDRKNMTLEERKSAYEEARARIFQSLEGKQP